MISMVIIILSAEPLFEIIQRGIENISIFAFGFILIWLILALLGGCVFFWAVWQDLLDN